MILIETQKYYHVLDTKFIFHFFDGHIYNVFSMWLNVVLIGRVEELINLRKAKKSRGKTQSSALELNRIFMFKHKST